MDNEKISISDIDTKKFKAKPDESIYEHTCKLINELERLKEFGYISDDIYDLVKISCEYHDYGKINNMMQERLKRINEGKSAKFNSKKEIHHNILSAYLLKRELFESDEDYNTVLFSILYHHNYCDIWEEIKLKKKEIKEILSEYKIYTIDNERKEKLNKLFYDDRTIKVKGFLHKCDYSASGNFQCEYINNFLESDLNNIISKWKLRDKKASWNELQDFCFSNNNENIMVIAQTGMGKTEAALRWIGNNKGFLILPLRVAINSMYERIKNDILKEDVTEKLAILHSNSLEYYISNNEYNMFDEVLQYEKIGKSLSLPLNISTMDQIFDFVFMYNSYELKLTTLSYSKIVIDEIQMYDARLLKILIVGLKKISKFGGKIAIMTATLPPFIKDLLVVNIDFKECNIKEFIDNDVVRHKVKLIDCSIESKDIIEQFEDNIKIGRSNKILVICNTIKQAQELYNDIKQKLKDDVYILHSRFIKKERNELERSILEFGRTYDNSGDIDVNSCIWISTSIVEASLDIDFDYIYTELNDLSSLFQRLGRCNRKALKCLDSFNVFVYMKCEYHDKHLFSLSKEALCKWNEENIEDNLLTEKQKMLMVNNYFTTENIKDSNYYKEYNNFDINYIIPYEFKKGDIKLRDLFTYTVIPKVIYLDNKEYIEKIKTKLEKSSNKEEKIKLMDDLMDFTLDIPQYMFYQTKREEYVKLGKLKIFLIDCKYDSGGYYNSHSGEGEFI